MNVLDWVLVAVALAYAVSGYWQGFVVGASATVGLLGGGVIGIVVAPLLLDRFTPSLTLSLVALLVVLVCASLGQALAAFLGARLRDRITWQPARALDAVGGAVLSAAAVLLVAWALGVAISGARLPLVNQEVRSSRVLATVDQVLPGDADQALQAFDEVVSSNVFPRYLEPFVPERIVHVHPPSHRVLRDPEIAAAARRTVKVTGAARACDRSIEGSGFVFAPHRVMTNAHVVAGVSEPTVEVGRRQLPATVVLYDPRVDVAVLDVDGLHRRPLAFDDSAGSGDPAAVLGYPQNGPLDVEPARIRVEQRLVGPDIYGDGTVDRDTYSVFSVVRSGNSGGPLVGRNGDVLGVVFAASVSDPHTGYALTAGEVADDAAAGRSATAPVRTGGCT